MKNYELTGDEFSALQSLRNRVGLVHALAACASQSLDLTPEYFYAFVADVDSSIEASLAAAYERYCASEVSSEGSAFLTVDDIVALIKVAQEGGNSYHPVDGLFDRLRKACELDPAMERVRDAFNVAMADTDGDARREAIARYALVCNPAARTFAQR